MKPTLILGLGNPLMGDDGIGYRAAELLAADPRLPADAESLGAGTDLLRWMNYMEGRIRVILVDAIMGDTSGGLETRQWNVHHLSAPQAVRLLQTAVPSLRRVRFELITVAIELVEVGHGLSPALTARLPAILETILEAVKMAERNLEPAC